MIDVHLNRETEAYDGGEQVLFVVRVGPENHVCSTIRKFYVGLDEDETYREASAFAEGASAAISAVSGLAARFIQTGRIQGNT